MANDPRDEMKALWQRQPAENAAVSLEELRRKAQGLQTTILWRNLREYIGGALAAAAFGYYFWQFHTPLVRAGALLSMVGVVWAMVGLHRHGAARNLPLEMARSTCLAFHRGELERQRDLLRGVWKWYLLPLVPGLVLFLIGLAREHMAGRWLPAAAVGTVCALAFLLVGHLNRSAARRLQHQIEALHELEKEP